MTGQIIIRFDNQVLQPSGDITVQEQSATGGLLTWHIAIIVIAGVAILVAIVAVIIVSWNNYSTSGIGASNNYNVSELYQDRQVGQTICVVTYNILDTTGHAPRASLLLFSKGI